MNDQSQQHAARSQAQDSEGSPPSPVASEAEHREERGYHAYAGQVELQFCPLKDLNLPASYTEVVSRFKRLQGDRDAEVLN